MGYIGTWANFNARWNTLELEVEEVLSVMHHNPQINWSTTLTETVISINHLLSERSISIVRARQIVNWTQNRMLEEALQ